MERLFYGRRSCEFLDVKALESKAKTPLEDFFSILL